MSRGDLALHDHTHRAWHDRHRRRPRAAGLAVFLLGLMLAPCAASSADAPAHRLAIETVKPGREGLELSARLTPDGGTLERNISWTIRTAAGQTAFTGETGTADVSVPPGDYLVDARYGAAALSSSVSLPRGTRLSVTFVLDAGGLRLQPRIDGVGETAPSRVHVYALDGPREGRLVAGGDMPADGLLRLPAGRYRVAATARNGNARAVTDVAVQGGRVSWIDMSLKAGLARFAFVGAPGTHVDWTVTDAEGNTITRLAGLDAKLALTPGTYTAKATVGEEFLTATFRIAAGETRDIMLGN